MLYHFNSYFCLVKAFLKYCSLFFLLFGANGQALSQDIDPVIQQMTQNLVSWTQEQFRLYGKVDQVKLDSMNQVIRNRQAEIELQKKETQAAMDTTGSKQIRVTMQQGNVITVPQGKRWKVKHVTCQTGIGDYSVLVTSVKFKDSYAEGEKIVMPAFTPEANLLTSDMSEISYNFVIIESKIK
jgi:hypothetical protein